MKLEDRIAIVTGSDSGIGRAIALLFASEGADVVITCAAAYDAAECGLRNLRAFSSTAA